MLPMMSSFRLSGAAGIAQQIQGDVQHEVGLALYATGANGWAAAVVHAGTGVVLGWDGWYWDGLGEEQRVPLEGLDFADFDDMPSKLLMNANMGWLGGPLAYHLMPTYSFADWATDIVALRADKPDDATTLAGFRSGDLVAYFPVGDRAEMISRIKQHFESLDGHGGEHALLVTAIVHARLAQD
jgi:hypothetical protein